jgi:hypothetical protein
MTTRSRTRILALLVLALTASSVPVEAAKRGKKVFTATINGKKWKSTKKYTCFATGGAFVAYGTKFGGLRGLTKILTVSCVNDLSLQTFPFTTTDCLITYGETRARPLAQRFWFQLVGGTEVTVESYDGTRMVARFRTLEPVTAAGLPDVTVEGEWRGPVVSGDCSR